VTQPHVAADADPFAAYRIRRCLKCDYDLTGLPLDNTCPECGEAYARDMMLVTGWSHARFVAGTGMWWLRFLLYFVLVLVLITLIWPVGLALAAWFIWSQFFADQNQRLLVTDTEIRRPQALRYRLLRRFDVACYPPPKLGRDLRRVRLRRCRDDLWKVFVYGSPGQASVTPSPLRIVLLCGEEEAQALAHELRLRIARALEQQEQEGRP
jgi:hypothetical protein